MTDATRESIELQFCDLCGRSIPQKEIESGAARTVAGKTIGACCLAGLVQDLPVQSAAVGPPSGASGKPLLFATLVVLAGVLGAAYYVDLKGADRDPRTSLAAMQGRLAALEKAVDDQERMRRLQGEDMVRDVAARMQGPFDRLRADLVALRGDLPKSGTGLDAIKARLTGVLGKLDDLVARQGAIESRLASSLTAVREELANVDRSLVDLRRKSAVQESTNGKSDASRRPVATLPDNLGRKVDQLDNDDPGVRWSAVDELIRSGDKRVLPYLLPKLKDPDPFVRRLCAEGFAQIGDVDSCGSLIEALADKEAIVRESAYKSLVKLSGKKIAFDPEASESARRGMVRKWQQWWKDRSKG